MSNVKPDLSYLDQFFGPPVFSKEGVFYPKRPLIELVGLDYEDDPSNGLGRISATPLTAETIATALGYVPAEKFKSQWNTAYSVDFRGQGTHTYGSDTTFTIDTKTWTKRGTSEEDNPLAIDATGLKFQPGNSTDIVGAYTGPRFGLKLSSLGIADLDWATKLRIFCEVDVPATNNYGFLECGIVDVMSGTPVWKIGGLKGFGPGRNLVADIVGSTATSPTYTEDASTAVMIIETRLAVSPQALALYTAASGAEFSASHPRVATGSSGVNAIANAFVGSGAGDLYLFLGAQRGTSQAAFTATVKSLRVDYKLD